MYYSFDKGKTWHLRHLNILYLTTPIFYKDKEVFSITSPKTLMVGRFYQDLE